MKKLYLAGPDVFLPGAKQHGERLKEVCTAHGLEGLFPMDGQIRTGKEATKLQTALAIFRADVELMLACDGAIVNMTPFRGPSMDSGTAMEVGYLNALNKPIFGYTTDMRAYYEKAVAYDRLIAEDPNRKYYSGSDGMIRDSKGDMIENDGLIDNLMMVGAALETAPISRSFEEAVLAASQYFSRLKGNNE